jgi:hypothetical protein
MPELSGFSTPAFQIDFPDDKEAQGRLNELWSSNVDAFTQQAITGNPWTESGAANQTSYYNPLNTDIPSGSRSALVSWSAFPNRLNQYLGANQYPANPYNVPLATLTELADTGNLSTYEIPQTLCPNAQWPSTYPQAVIHPYGPYGPRGWQDEYCEWSVTRNAAGKITRVDFTCENPEYWYSLWRISPQRVADLYQETLNYGVPADQHIVVTIDDLQLVDPSTGTPVVDPSTGTPAYNPLNRWNSGPVSVRGSNPSGGAMHLTSTPNTLQTELGLAGGATVQRTQGNASAQQLICCSVYGQPYRHSDPHIGQSVNQLVVQGANAFQVSLQDPPGLYIQSPANLATQFFLPDDPKLPVGATAAQCWQVVRGQDPANGPVTDPLTGEQFPGNLILHVAFQLPLEWIEAGVSFTVGDIGIGASAESAQPIDWASQIVQTFNMGLYGLPLPVGSALPQLACVGGATDAGQLQPIQMTYADLWDAYYATAVSNPVGQTMNLASNTVIVPAVVEQGATGLAMALTFGYSTPSPPTELPQVVFPGGGIAATPVSFEPVMYAPPGNSYPSENCVLKLTLDVDAGAPLGLQGLQLGPGSPETAPAFVNVVAAGTLAATG